SIAPLLLRRAPLETDAVQKRKDRAARPWYSSPHVILIAGLVGLGLFWLWPRDPGVKNLDYDDFMQIIRADDAAVHLNVKIGRSEIRGEIVTADVASDGKTVPGKLVETKAFRVRRPPDVSDPDLLRLLRDGGHSYRAEDEESPLRGVWSVIVSF